MKKLLHLFKYFNLVVLVLSFMACAATRKTESTGQYVDDSVITSKVKTAVFNEDSLKSLQVNVKTYKGVVQLSGFVDSAENSRKAGLLASRIEGVSKVQNDLIVR